MGMTSGACFVIQMEKYAGPVTFLVFLGLNVTEKRFLICCNIIFGKTVATGRELFCWYHIWDGKDIKIDSSKVKIFLVSQQELGARM